jgi:prephenate dehydrogenase
MPGAIPFANVAVLGGGLLGGSLALALRGRQGLRRSVLWARRPETVAQARAMGIDSTGDLASAVAAADLVVLATPVGAMPALVGDAVAAGLPAAAVLTDVGSVKRAPHAALTACLGGRAFVGSHPMAGSERAGIAAARADLFEGAACFVTGDEGATAAALRRVADFWRAIGCRVTRLDPAAHDALVARVSHLPHLLAAALARVALRIEGQGDSGGGGLRDTTRVASGEPAMWAEIVAQNRDALAGPLREMIDEMREVLALVEAGREEPLRAWLGRAKQLRDALRVPGADKTGE